MFKRPIPILVILYTCLLLFACSKDATKPATPVVVTESFAFSDLKVNDAYSGFSYQGVNQSPLLKISFSVPVDKASMNNAIVLKSSSGIAQALTISLTDADKTVIIQPASPLAYLTKYTLTASTALKSAKGTNLSSPVTVNLLTAVDETDKYPRISDDALLDLVEKQTLKYFWDFGHSASGMARERNSSGNTVTTGGSGFGIMGLVAGISRNFVSRVDGLARMQKIVHFLQTADRFHGAYPHWIDGNTGKVIAFSQKDDGGDLVETSFLMEGLITARQYFNSADPAESRLRDDITTLYNGVEWTWYRKENSNTLYWHWSPNYSWDMNMPVKGWDEALVTYVLAAGSTPFGIPKVVYDNGWALNGAIKNGAQYYGVQLPLGPANGGPLFFEHYSFLGINPIGLNDAYADYETQVKAHTMIQYYYAGLNPKQFYGYGPNCWGLTASDDINGYMAHEISNDNGVISPTAALSSFPYTPDQSMQALKYFYYKLGDKLFGDYGFYDAFSMQEGWFANSTLAIDQGPIIVMIENYRSKLLWNLFMSAPEVKGGMQKLGFSSPNL
jgi:hypothetical protein